MNSLRQSRIYIAIVLGIVYVMLAFVVNARLLTEFDLSSIIWLQIVIPRVFDFPFSVLSLIGSFEITTVFVLLVLFFAFRPQNRLALFVLFLGIVAVEGMGKLFLVQPGPPHELSRMVRIFSMPTGSVYTPFSFPSGHAARSAYITLVLLAWIQHSRLKMQVKAPLVILLVAGEAVMLVSRVYLGEHWASDVIAGTALGLACALPSMAYRLDPVRLRQ